MRSLFNRSTALLAAVFIIGWGSAMAISRLAAAQGRPEVPEPPGQKTMAPDAGDIYYVAETGIGSDGKSWVNAFTNLQDALFAASGGDEIWVAAGVYYPDEGFGQFNNAVSSTFVMTDGVTIYGGFDTNDTQLSDRDWERNVTVLSGDIDQNDFSGADNIVYSPADINGNNAYHVVTAKGVSTTAVIDGFTITAGDAAPSSPERRGGGFFCDGSGAGNYCYPKLVNINFIGNSGNHSAGAMLNYGSNGGDSSPTLVHVKFQSNQADLDGGAMENHGWAGKSNPYLEDVIFIDNTSGKRGAGMYNLGSSNGESSPYLLNVIFSGNKAEQHGGAMFNDGSDGISSPILVNVLLKGNYAGNFAGAIFNSGSSGGVNLPVLTNVTFSGNTAKYIGGALFNSGFDGTSSTEVYNGIFWDNKDGSGTETITSTVYNTNATVKFWNSLAQGTGGSDHWIGDPQIQDGGDNIDENPKFVEPLNPDDSPTEEGDLHLRLDSPALDTGKNLYVTSIPVGIDLNGMVRIVDGNMDGSEIVDMGAYERQLVSIFQPLVFR